MKKISVIVFFGLVCSFNAAHAATMRTNNLPFCVSKDLYCANSTSIKLISFTPGNSVYNNESFDITDGQPWGGVSLNSDYANTLTVLAGRKKSDGVRTWVQMNMQDTKNSLAPNGIEWSKYNLASSNYSNDSTPDQLNFAFYGTLQLELNATIYTCPNIIIGQGSSSVLDIFNWWIFSNNNQNATKPTYSNTAIIFCTFAETQSAQLLFSTASYSQDGFEVQLAK